APVHLLAEGESLSLRSEPTGHSPDHPHAGKAEVRVAPHLLDTSGPATYPVHEEPVEAEASSGPPSFLAVLPLRIGRFIARRLRRLRDWLYLISVAAGVAMLIGFLFKYTLALHLGAAVIIIANIGMLVVGAAYLVTIPFTDGPVQGLACLLLPPYAIYYWIAHWHKMRKPVKNTLGAFLPIALVGLAYFFYEEGPALEQAVEKTLPAVGRTVEEKLERVDPFK
ncbi:MAG TPA: hypothetical protein VHB77_02705, partial [Planctomycetaceae bacterium]|nr:hypothetical protein [Planctomycetaceae bacterium]